MYDSHYGFSDRPFQLTPDARFWFESKTHRTAMAYLGYGLAQGEGFIVVTGDVGAGKTTLVGHLMASVDPQRLNAIRIVSTQVEDEDMLRLTAQQLGLATEGLAKAQLLERIERTLRLHASEGRQTLLIVDEAQNLPLSALEELRMLSNFQSGGKSLLQIFLLGQPEFRDRLQRSEHLEQLRQRVIATHHLDAMETDEVGAYVEHRLKHVGWTGRPTFAPGVYARLAEASGCVPRRINQLVNRLLLLGEVEHAETIDLDMLDEVIADLAGDADDDATAPPTPVDFIVPAASPAHPDAPAADASAHVPGIMEALARELASRDEQIAELQQAVMELAEMRGSDAPAPVAEPEHHEPLLAAIAELTHRIEALEVRTGDQNEAIRHVLTMLIEWLEAENASVRAA